MIKLFSYEGTVEFASDAGVNTDETQPNYSFFNAFFKRLNGTLITLETSTSLGVLRERDD